MVSSRACSAELRSMTNIPYFVDAGFDPPVENCALHSG